MYCGTLRKEKAAQRYRKNRESCVVRFDDGNGLYTVRSIEPKKCAEKGSQRKTEGS